LSAASSYAVTAEELLGTEQRKDLLRLVTAGSVDDGKSTLLGRLLYDSQSIYEDQLNAVRRASRGDLELALLTDGLRAEREQGITIDVAYRYFSTAKRKFILADTPGHEQYTRNMATGASNADLAILLVDASRGVQPQSKRHAFIIGLVGIRHLVVLVNKMDLVGYSKEVFLNLRQELRSAIRQLEFESVQFFPVSANSGANVVHRSSLMPWFNEPALLESLENIDVTRTEHSKPFRLPIQLVQRTSAFRGYSGQIAAGRIAVGDAVTVLPSLRTTRIKSIVSFDGELKQAIVPQSVTITVEDELDISRGDVLAAADHPPISTRNFQAQMIWFSEQPLSTHRRYLLKHTTQTTAADIEVESRLDIHTLRSGPADTLHMNDIGTVHIETSRAIFFDPYRQSRTTGCFILIDPDTNNTVAAGMIVASVHANVYPNRQKDAQGGQIFNLTGQQSLIRMVKDCLHKLAANNVVVLSQWHQGAVELLCNAGLHVLVLNAPKEVTRVDASEAGLRALLKVIGLTREIAPKETETAV
jgi:sulfate adenylyltransferase large subunit